MTTKEVLAQVVQEVQRAREMWGTRFDEKNTLNDWIAYVSIYLGRAAVMGTPKEEVKKNIRKAAALVFSALYWAENDSLAPRHYDDEPRPTSLPDIK
jgi:hypothetical protein